MRVLFEKRCEVALDGLGYSIQAVNVGDEIDLAPDVAETCIRGGLAVAIDAPVETKVVKPAETKPARAPKEKKGKAKPAAESSEPAAE